MSVTLRGGCAFLHYVRMNKIGAVHFDHVTHTPEFVHYFILGAFGLGRIGEVIVKALYIAREKGTSLVGVIANGDHIIKRNTDVFIHVV